MREKLTKVGIWRLYGLGSFLIGSQVPCDKYVNTRKSIMWWLTSRAVRIRDWRKYGYCVSCGEKIEHWQNADAGHFAPAQGCGMNLLFDPYNVNMECKHCNGMDEGHLIPYRRELIHRYGQKQVDRIESLYFAHRKNPGAAKEWTVLEYDANIKEMIEAMKTENMLETFTESGLVVS